MKKILFLICTLGFLGCQTPSGRGAGPSPADESAADVRSAIESVAGAVTQKKVQIKYCPVCGRRYSPSQAVCPYDQSELKELKDE